MQILTNQLLDFCGINLWLDNYTEYPYKFIEIYLNSPCMVVLPIENATVSNMLDYQQIKNLYKKMLVMLNVYHGAISQVELYYHTKQNFSNTDKKILTEKLLIYSPKIIVIFGELEFLDDQLLNLYKIDVNYILHPKYLLANVNEKIIAYNSLIKCQQKIMNNV